MSALLSHLLALICAVLLVLPPGWCCATPRQPAPEPPAKVTHSCCQHQEEQPSSSQEPVPIEKCCCEKDLANPPNPETFAPDLAISIQVAVLDASALQAVGVGLLDFTDPLPSAPLNVLLCVWRC